MYSRKAQKNAELERSAVDVDAPKRLQAETAAELDPCSTILDRAFKEELLVASSQGRRCVTLQLGLKFAQ
jgi:hypothetical protein